MTSVIKTKALTVALQALQQSSNGLTLDQVIDQVLFHIEHFHSRREAIAVIRDGLRSEPSVLQIDNIYRIKEPTREPF